MGVVYKYKLEEFWYEIIRKEYAWNPEMDFTRKDWRNIEKLPLCQWMEYSLKDYFEQRKRFLNKNILCLIDIRKFNDINVGLFNLCQDAYLQEHKQMKINYESELWSTYFKFDYKSIVVQQQYSSKQYGILKKKILNSLRKSFDEFILAFEIYLHEFVYKETNVPIIDQIRRINPKYVISFNYTLTEKLYGIKEENVHHIHGKIREDLNFGKNNMVLGVNEQQDMDFIYFVKYFQRIQKASGVSYKNFINSYIRNDRGRNVKEEYKLHIYGHSLDETDEDILRYIIGKTDEQGRLNLNSKQIVIYYYDASDYEQKVVNLIKLYGRPIVEENIEKEIFKFVKTDNTPINENFK